MYKSDLTCNPPQPILDVDNVLAILDSISLFGGLTGSQLQHLLHNMSQIYCPAESVIFHHGEPPSAIYVVLSGSVRLRLPEPRHPLSRIELRAGDCFGETSVIGIQPHVATTVAVQDTELLVLEQSALMSIFSEDKDLFSQLMLNIARETSRRLHRACELLAAYDSGPDDPIYAETRH